MAWWEREYHQESEERRGIVPRWPPITARTLVFVHVAAFALMLALRHDDGPAAVNAATLTGKQLSAWAILIHPYSTVEFFPALFTVIGVWAFGNLLENRLGRGRFLSLYLAGNLIAGLAFYAFARFVPKLSIAPLDYPAGALAAWTVAAFCTFEGEHGDLFGKVMPISRIILIFAGIAVGLTLLIHQQTAVAWLLAVLAAAGVARLMSLLPATEDGSMFAAVLRRRTAVLPARRRPAASRPPPGPALPNVDDLLAKISRDGIDSLTIAERSRLDAAREARQRQATSPRR